MTEHGWARDFVRSLDMLVLASKLDWPGLFRGAIDVDFRCWSNRLDVADRLSVEGRLLFHARYWVGIFDDDCRRWHRVGTGGSAEPAKVQCQPALKAGIAQSSDFMEQKEQ